MSKGGFSVFMALLFLFVVSFGLMSVIRYAGNFIFKDDSVGNLTEQLWRVFLQISDAGAVAEDGEANVWHKITGIVTIFLGLVLFSSLVAFITAQFEAKLEELKKGKSDVIEKDHTLILGFGDRVLEIIRELVIANESEKSPAIVVLSDVEKDEMDDFFRERVEDPKTTRIITRSGVTSSLQMLQKVSISEAKSVVILNDATVDAPDVEKELADARVLKTIMAVIACTGEENLPPIVAEIHQPNIMKLAGKISPHITTVEEHSLLAKLIVQTSRVSGLAMVYDNLVGFDGDEFCYYRPKAGWSGKTYIELIYHFPTCCLLGYRDRDGNVVVNPLPDTVMDEEWEALLLAEDDSTISFSKKPVAHAQIEETPAAALESQIEKELIVGWTKKSAIIVDEYTDYLPEGSTIDVIVSKITEEMKAEFKAVQSEHTEIKMNLIKGDIHKEGVVARLRPEQYDNVIILKDDGGVAELRDSETIATLLEFRHYFRELGTEVKTQLVSEVADSDNVEVIQQVGVKDFLISNKFVSKIYAQLSEDPDVMKAYDELFKAEGSEIYLKPMTLFLQKEGTYTFADLCEAAIRRNETAFGVRIASEEKDADKGYGIYVNPDKTEKFTLSRNDYLITLAEDES
ncbi:MAG: hypothetical protein JXK07_00755 [Spirochaetes bacterium]|nr:hypothetical protein [Spirochaetota bacterium]MBN2770265.1 hypothetical protein [Spirochaetota bacterium]